MIKESFVLKGSISEIIAMIHDMINNHNDVNE